MKNDYDEDEDEYSRSFSKESKRPKRKYTKQDVENVDFTKKESLDADRKESARKQDSIYEKDDDRKLSSAKQSLAKEYSKKHSLGKASLAKSDLEEQQPDSNVKQENVKQWYDEILEEEGKIGGVENGEEGDKDDLEKFESDEEDIDFQNELQQFYSWLQKEPYLPKNIDDEVVITFLWGSANVEEAEQKFQNYFYARQEMKSVFGDRHPCSPNNLLKYDAVCVVPLTSGTQKKWIIFATWLAHEDPEKFSIFHMMKLIFTELDILLQENQIRGKTISILIDMDGYTEEHTKKITRFAGKKLCYLFTDCFPAKFNGFYIINAPTHVFDYTSLFGPFDFHIVEYLEDLPGFLPKKFLPSDLSGEPDAPLRNTLFEPFFKRMRRCGNWLAYEEFLRSQELMLRMTTTREEFYLESDGPNKDKKNKEGGKGKEKEKKKGGKKKKKK